MGLDLVRLTPNQLMVLPPSVGVLVGSARIHWIPVDAAHTPPPANGWDLVLILPHNGCTRSPAVTVPFARCLGERFHGAGGRSTWQRLVSV